jgi:hypothetical protein
MPKRLAAALFLLLLPFSVNAEPLSVAETGGMMQKKYRHLAPKLWGKPFPAW